MARRWQCLEVGCGATISAGSDEELVAAANAHVRAAHDSYELEEVILAGAEDEAEGTQSRANGGDR